MSKSKKHHYIPKGILRNFCFASDSIWFFNKDKAAEGVKRRNIDNVFYAHHLNSIWLQQGQKWERDVSVEDFFSNEIDNEIPEMVRVLERFMGDRPLDTLQADERRQITQFFYNHMLRTPEVSQKNVEKVLYGQNYGSNQKRDQKFEDTARSIAAGHQNTKVLNELFSLKLAIAKPENPKKQFIVSSNPVIRICEPGKSNILDHSVQLWAALTPKLAVGLISGETGFVRAKLSTRQVSAWNKSWAGQSSCFAAQSKELVQSLVRHSTIQTNQ